MPDERPVKVVVDCSVPDRDAAVAYTQDQVEAVLKKRVAGELTNEETAARLVELADQAAAAAGLPDRTTVVPLDDDELADFDARKAEADAAGPPEPPPPPAADAVLEALNDLDPEKASVADVVNAVKAALQQAGAAAARP